MDRQPKLELDPLPVFDSNNDRINDSMTIQDIVRELRTVHVWEDIDKLEEVLLSKEDRVNQEIEQLKEKFEMERLAKVHAVEEFKKREEMCEKGKKIKEAYETLLRDIKTTKFAERETIDKMRKNNSELESELLELRKLKEKWVQVSDDHDIAEIRKMNGELEREVLELRKLNEKWVQVSDDNTELMRKNGELETQVSELRKLGDENTRLRSMLCVLEGERNTLAALVRNDCELEEEVKRNLTTIDELRSENRKLEDKKCKYEKMVESLNRKFEELQGRVVKLEDDTERLMSVDVSGGGNNKKEELFADNWVTLNEKDEWDVHDNVIGNDKVKVSLPRNGDICHSLGAAAGIAQPLSKENKDAKGSSLARGRMESQKVIEIINLDDDDDDDGDVCSSRVLHGKKAEFGITMKTEYPSSSGEIQPRKRKMYISEVYQRRKKGNDV